MSQINYLGVQDIEGTIRVTFDRSPYMGTINFEKDITIGNRIIDIQHLTPQHPEPNPF